MIITSKEMNFKNELINIVVSVIRDLIMLVKVQYGYNNIQAYLHCLNCNLTLWVVHHVVDKILLV